MSLFQTAEYTVPVTELDVEHLSTDRRRTLRNQASIDRGIHPATRLPLASTGTCGECKFLSHNNGRYLKCGLYFPHFVTNGAGTDIRAKWPACSGFEKRVEP